MSLRLMDKPPVLEGGEWRCGDCGGPAVTAACFGGEQAVWVDCTSCGRTDVVNLWAEGEPGHAATDS